MIGDFLYQLTSKDAATAPVLQRQLLRAVGTPAAAATVSVSSTPVPGDKVWRVTNITCQAQPGAAQFCRRLSVNAIDSTGGVLGVIDFFNPNPAIGAAILVGFARMTNMILFPGEVIQLTGNFDAGAANNNVFLDLHVLHVPKGNLQLR